MPGLQVVVLVAAPPPRESRDPRMPHPATTPPSPGTAAEAVRPPLHWTRDVGRSTAYVTAGSLVRAQPSAQTKQPAAGARLARSLELRPTVACLRLRSAQRPAETSLPVPQPAGRGRDSRLASPLAPSSLSCCRARRARWRTSISQRPRVFVGAGSLEQIPKASARRLRAWSGAAEKREAATDSSPGQVVVRRKAICLLLWGSRFRIFFIKVF